MLRMVVEGIGFDNLRQTVVVLKDWDGRKALLIWIGSNEARAIANELEGIKPPRPSTHDLLLAGVKAARGHVVRVLINDLQDATFYATIDIDTPWGVRHIDARPSDAIAVAVRAKCPVFVAGTVMDALIDADAISAAPSISPGEQAAGEESSSLPPALPALEDLEEADDADDEIDRFRRLIGDL
jgi:bifunctional DNase/RNase